MKIHQVRLGLATNSSSTHSVILMPGLTDHGMDGTFGWDNFVAASQEAKTRYLAAQLKGVLHAVASEEVTEAVVQAWTGVDLDQAREDYVDHQSAWVLPMDWDGRGPDKLFFDSLKDFVLKNDVAILGGNDNDEDRHPLKGNDFTIAIPTDGGGRSPMVCRLDPEGYWVLFNRKTGTKIRMSFGANGQEVEPSRSAAPELVDIKITDWCNKGCDFCYQDSTTAGKHAETAYLKALARNLGDLRVFEVAIGGGEPTAHPDFLEILHAFRSHGVVPNFTTKSTAWLKDERRRGPILDAVGAFALSVDCAGDVDALASMRDTYEIDDKKINAQFVMGTLRDYGFEQLLETAARRHIRLTLLGYKTNGRGGGYEPEDYSGWIDSLKKVRVAVGWGPKLGIDTALAAEYQSQLSDAGVPRWCYEVEEGKFSMYIDAVAYKAARSSYGEVLAMRPLKARGPYSRIGAEIAEIFAAF